ncbi:MAG: DNA ligase [Promethearchaeota archaeon]|nr:MAG: DNA ligase [Candidatus Lokiarchaeota archaeon]
MIKDQNPETERIKELEQQILYHRNLYYNKSPEISDARYDQLEDELRVLDPHNPLFYKVGQDAAEIFTKKEHIIAMNSQDKASSPEEFLKWAQNRDFSIYIVQFKLDGISIELQYKSGIFQCAVTRGDGKVGDDVSQNVMKMKGFLPKLPIRFTGAVRAEIVLFKNLFKAKYPDKQNPRNAAAGIVRRKDGEGSEDLNLIYYDAISTNINQMNFRDEIDKIKWLKAQGFDTVTTKTVKEAREIITIREELSNKTRNELNYEIDGLVIKGKEIDLDDLQRARPMSQIAFKFQAEEIDTILKDVEWSISGHIYTPVAVLEPIQLMGSTVSRASLANPNLFRELNLRIGSRVIVSKRGDIIPKIESVLSTPENALTIEIPTSCETCGSELIDEGTRLFCPDESCPKRTYHRLQKWIKKLGIKHFSEKLILSKLFETHKVTSIPDLYRLTEADLIKFDSVRQRTAQKALKNLYTIKELPLERFIAGFDIEGIGEKLVKRIVDAGYNTLEQIKRATIQELSMIDGIGDITAEILLKGMEAHYGEMQQLLDTKKITIKSPKLTGSLMGKTFCFTGKLNTMTRKEAEALVIENGGEAKGNVVKNLSYLVTNSAANTSKFLKAQKQGTKIISEKEFLDLI